MAARARLRFATIAPRAICRTLLSWLWAALLLIPLSGEHAAKAQTAPVPAAKAPYTLHVYEDLLQLPTLVLNSAQQPYKGLTAAQFTLQLDGGPPFHPRHTRPEGDDPLQIALVIDASQASTLVLAHQIMANAPTKLQTWLGPADRFSVYALDCHLIRSANSLPYSTIHLQNSLAAALAAPDLHRQNAGMGCGTNRRLWDSLATVITHLSEQPGRRAIVVVSNGRDGGNQTYWNLLARYAGRFNTTLMGLRPQDSDPPPIDPAIRQPLSAYPTEAFVKPNENIFALLCGETGGLVVPVDRDTISLQMNRAIDLLRQRYILEFARPRNDTPGLHHIDASIPDRHAIVLSAGIAFPPRSSTQDTEPGAVPSDPARAPQLGDRKVLTQPQ